MSDLNEAVLPSIWTLARRSLLDERAESVDKLITRLTPHALLKRAGTERPSSRHVGPSVRALLALGLIAASSDGSVGLTDEAADEAKFRLEITQRLLRVPDGQDPWEVREGASRLEYHLEMSVAWLHALGLGVEVAGFERAGDLLNHQFGVDRPLLRDTAPFNTLERLVRWLGVGAFTSGTAARDALIPDPTAIVRSALEQLMPEPSMTAGEFLLRSAELFPWMPHGTLGRAIAERMNAVPDASARTGRFPEGLSLALIRLELEQVIELHGGDDPKQRVLMSYRGEAGRGVARVVKA
jgi:hypothetical protein